MLEYIDGCTLYDLALQSGFGDVKIYVYVTFFLFWNLIIFFFEIKKKHAKYVTRQVLDALVYIHHTNRIHRDIKSQNVLLGPQVNNMIFL